MKSLLLGYDANQRPIHLDPEQRRIHMHVIGASGSGKSKFLESMIRGDLRNRQGFCLLDPHGTLYNEVVAYCSHNVLRRDIIPLNLSSPDAIVGFNPFQKANLASVAVQVDRRIAATMHAWNVESTDQTPTLERTLRLIYTVMLDQNLALPEIQHLIDFNAADIRSHLIDRLETPLVQKEWRELQQLKAKEWRDEILSAKNRLFRFLTSPALTRFMGLSDRSLDLKSIMDEGRVLLVNLAPSDSLSEENARVFGALLVNEFFECARRRQKDACGRDPRPYYLYMDEFQNFVSLDIADMLDQVRKFGLFTVLSHQRFGQLDDNITDAVLTNCRIKAVFGGLTFESAQLMARELFLTQLDAKKVKVAIYQTKFWPKEEMRQVRTHSTSRSSSSGWSETATTGYSSTISAGEFFGPDQWFSGQTSVGTSATTARGNSRSSARGSSGSDSYGESESVADIPVFVPVPFQELSSVQYYSLDEQLSELTAALKEQYSRHCFVKLPGEEAEPMLVPKVSQPYTPPANIRRYEDRLLANSNALSAAEVDELIAARERLLLEEAVGSFNGPHQTDRDPDVARPAPVLSIWNRGRAASTPQVEEKDEQANTETARNRQKRTRPRTGTA